MGFMSEVETCQPLDSSCRAEDVPSALDAGVAVPWDAASVPSCASGQAAYNDYVAAQLKEYNLCSTDSMCLVPNGVGPGPSNPCQQPCGLTLSPQAINSQILQRLDTFGNAACALCPGVTQVQCPFVPPTMTHCVDGHCQTMNP
jgi:hypothetical protein